MKILFAINSALSQSLRKNSWISIGKWSSFFQLSICWVLGHWHCWAHLLILILCRYHCHTCKMVDGVGVCTVCAKVCHKDHEISYAKYGSFFCDCGAKEDGSCLVRVWNICWVRRGDLLVTRECWSQTRKLPYHLHGGPGLGVSSGSVTDHGLISSLLRMLELARSLKIL